MDKWSSLLIWNDHLSVNTGAVGSNPDSAMLYSGIGSDER